MRENSRIFFDQNSNTWAATQFETNLRCPLASLHHFPSFFTSLHSSLPCSQHSDSDRFRRNPTAGSALIGRQSGCAPSSSAAPKSTSNGGESASAAGEDVADGSEDSKPKRRRDSLWGSGIWRRKRRRIGFPLDGSSKTESERPVPLSGQSISTTVIRSITSGTLSGTTWFPCSITSPTTWSINLCVSNNSNLPRNKFHSFVSKNILDMPCIFPICFLLLNFL